MIAELNQDNLGNEIKTGLKLVDCYTTWCTYCTMMHPILEELDKDGYWIGQIDCDKNPNIASQFGIQGFPTCLLFKNGVLVDKIVGFHNKPQLLDRIAKQL